MLGIFCRRQKRGLFSPVFTFLKEHSRGYVTEKRSKPAKKEPFLTRRENPQHVLKKRLRFFSWEAGLGKADEI